MTRAPICLCLFDDNSGNDYSNEEKMAEKDPSYWLQPDVSPANYDIAKHVLNVRVDRNRDGIATATISLDNVRSRYTDDLFASLTRMNPVLDEQVERTKSIDKRIIEGKKFFLSEYVFVTIYMGYYTGAGKWDYIKKKFSGAITSMQFSFNSGGTPQINLTAEDAFTFMGNSRMQNIEATMVGDNGEIQSEASKLVYSYTADASAEDVGYMTGHVYNNPKYVPVTETPQTTDLTDKKPTVPKKERPKYKIAKKFKTLNTATEFWGSRDSQAVVRCIVRYNEKIKTMYPVAEDELKKTGFLNFMSTGIYQTLSDAVKFKENEKIRKRLMITKIFVCMTGEGGNEYSTMSAYDPRVRENRVQHPVSQGFSDFLLSMASRHNFNVFVRDFKGERVLFFMPPIIMQQPHFTYWYGSLNKEVIADAGNSFFRLQSFTPRLNQIQLGADFHCSEFDKDTGLLTFIRAQIVKGNSEALVQFLQIEGKKDGGIKSGSTGTQAGDSVTKLVATANSHYVSSSYWGTAEEMILKSLTETEADFIETDMEMEGNPAIDVGMTLAVKGVDPSGSANPRFDANYLVTSVSDEWSGTYKTSLKGITRALQGLTKASNGSGVYKGEGVSSYTGLWDSRLLLDPSLLTLPEEGKTLDSEGDAEQALNNTYSAFYDHMRTVYTDETTAKNEAMSALLNKKHPANADPFIGVHTLVKGLKGKNPVDNEEHTIVESEEQDFYSSKLKKAGVSILPYDSLFDALTYNAIPQKDFSVFDEREKLFKARTK